MAAAKTDPPAPLLSAFEVRARAGEPFAVVRVQDLQGTLPVGRDAWGRANKAQPALLSTEVSFARAFGRASAEDRVSAETAHYGTLSKSLLASLDLFNKNNNNSSAAAPAPSRAEGEAADGPHAADVFELLWVGLTGRVVDGSARALPLDRVPFLDTARLRSLSLAVRLPKASLVGRGVSLSAAACFHDVGGGNPVLGFSRALTLHALHVPTLIGVNANERAAKQMVVADVEVEKLDVARDIHPELEKLVVEVSNGRKKPTTEDSKVALTDLSYARPWRLRRSRRWRHWGHS